MSRLIAVKFFSVLLVGVVLVADLSSTAAGMLICLGDGAASGCCNDSRGTRPSASGDATPSLSRGGCDCCITVDALPGIAGAHSQEASLDLLAGPAHLQNVVLPSSTRLPRVASSDSAETRLSSLRTVVLLV